MDALTHDFAALTAFLERVPCVHAPIASGDLGNGLWWVKFVLDLTHPLAWNVVQELGHVLNYVSLEERLPTVFMPVSSPPYLNGGPQQCLAWVIESKAADFTPSTCAEWLEGRLPRPVEDETEWKIED